MPACVFAECVSTKIKQPKCMQSPTQSNDCNQASQCIQFSNCISVQMHHPSVINSSQHIRLNMSSFILAFENMHMVENESRSEWVRRQLGKLNFLLISITVWICIYGRFIVGPDCIVNRLYSPICHNAMTDWRMGSFAALQLHYSVLSSVWRKCDGTH